MFQTDSLSLIVLFVGLSLLPFVAMIATSYLKIVVVMSLIRNALGIQSIPPNMVINALAMILTFYIMAPVLSESWDIAKTQMASRQGAAVAPAAAQPPMPQGTVGPYACGGLLQPALAQGQAGHHGQEHPQRHFAAGPRAVHRHAVQGGLYAVRQYHCGAQ